MADYERELQKCRQACGKRFPEFVRFFDNYSGAPGTVLDLGCGQGRDALLAASFGHTVLGVDSSPTGIAQMQESSYSQGLDVRGIVADVLRYRPKRKYHVVILDRVLHLLPTDEDRLSVLRSASGATRVGGHVLVADTPRQQVLIVGFFDATRWSVTRPRKGFVFAQLLRRHTRS